MWYCVCTTKKKKVNDTMEVTNFLSISFIETSTNRVCTLAKGTWKRREEVKTAFTGAGGGVGGGNGGINCAFQQVFPSFYASGYVYNDCLTHLNSRKIPDMLYLPTVTWAKTFQGHWKLCWYISSWEWRIPSHAVSVPKESCMKVFHYWCGQAYCVPNYHSRLKFSLHENWQHS